jgi:hypothetical protein
VGEAHPSKALAAARSLRRPLATGRWTALAAGFRGDLTPIRDTHDLAVLRGRTDFSLLLLNLALPADPFAGCE